MKRLQTILLGLVLLISGHAHAQAIGDIISYQGKLVNADGTPKANGTYSVTFKIYENGAATTFNQTSPVATLGGVFNAFLSVGALKFDPAKQYQLGVTFDGVETKHAIASVPVAQTAKSAIEAATAKTADTAKIADAAKVADVVRSGGVSNMFMKETANSVGYLEKSGSAYVTVPGLEATFTSKSTVAEVTFNTSDVWNDTANSETWFRIVLDGQVKAVGLFGYTYPANLRVPLNLNWIGDIPAGDHTVKVEWMNNGKGISFIGDGGKARLLIKTVDK